VNRAAILVGVLTGLLSGTAHGCGSCPDWPPFPDGSYVVVDAPEAWQIGIPFEFQREGQRGTITIEYVDETGAEWRVVY
jgi:hypothetical protein